MKIFDTLYYHYYLFYSKITKDNEPYATTIFSLSASESFLVNGIIDFIAVKLFCYRIDKLWMLLIFLIILITNYLVYNRSGRARKIVGKRPLLMNNYRISVGFTILFFVLTASWLFWGHFYTKNILNECK